MLSSSSAPSFDPFLARSFRGIIAFFIVFILPFSRPFWFPSFTVYALFLSPTFPPCTSSSSRPINSRFIEQAPAVDSLSRALSLCLFFEHFEILPGLPFSATSITAGGSMGKGTAAGWSRHDGGVLFSSSAHGVISLGGEGNSYRNLGISVSFSREKPSPSSSPTVVQLSGRLKDCPGLRYRTHWASLVTFTVIYC